MNIVIVEDSIGKGISLAEQFVEFSEVNPQYDINVPDICYFCADAEKARTDIQKNAQYGFNIQLVNLENFIQAMNEYFNAQECTYIIMDFMLEKDGSEGVPKDRVNIRYARNKNRLAGNHLWFYTATGTDNERVLDELVGAEHRLDVLESDTDFLRLELDNNNFLSALNADQAVEV